MPSNELSRSLRLVPILAFILTALSLSACGHQNSVGGVKITRAPAQTAEFFEAHPSKIIGKHPLIKVGNDGASVDSPLRQYIPAFGLVVMPGVGECTGTHLGNGYVLTAGHCFSDETNPAPQVKMHASCSGVQVRWGYRGADPRTGKPIIDSVGQCTEIVYAELSKDRDFSIFKVDHFPTAKVPVSLTARPANGTKITIFGFPQGRPMEWSQYCSVINSTYKSNYTFEHQCDTEPGNSGSAIMAVSPNGTLSVIGVHDGATPMGMDYNYGTYMFDARAVMSTKGINIDSSIGTSWF
jgi:V8-like Glu-specific endopeptidase